MEDQIDEILHRFRVTGNAFQVASRELHKTFTLALNEASWKAQQEMRDIGFQHPDDVATMVLSADARARLEEAKVIRRNWSLIGNDKNFTRGLDERIAELEAAQGKK